MQEGAVIIGDYEVVFEPYPIDIAEELGRAGWRLWRLKIFIADDPDAGVVLETLRLRGS
jgi:hypothetical protein